MKNLLNSSSFVSDFLNLFPKTKPTIGLAVSGGIDSMVMADVFRRCLKYKQYQLIVLHFNHKWRKAASNDAKFVRNYCANYGLTFVSGEAAGKVVKSEENARAQRYNFFKHMMKKHKLNLICTAHHMDDQLETVLYRLLRGTGPQGLMPIKQFYKMYNDSLVVGRPLLGVSRSTIEEYARKYKIRYVIDKSNKDISYKRNLLRLKVIPHFASVNNNAKENILNSMFLIHCQNVVSQKQYHKMLKKVSCRSQYVWSRKHFLKLKAEEKYFMLYSYLNAKAIKGSLSKISDLLDSIELKQSIDLDKEHRLQCSGNTISFTNRLKKTYKKNIKVQVNLKFKLQKKENIKINNDSSISLEPYGNKSFAKKFPSDKSKMAYVNLAFLSDKTITIRNRKQADIFKPLGFPCTVKLKKYLINKKIPVEKREKLLLLCKGKEVLWIPGYSISDKIKVATKPTTILKLR